MRKTVALFGLALFLLLTAMTIGLRRTTAVHAPVQLVRPTQIAPTPPRPPPPPVAPVADARSALSIGDVVRLDASLSNSLVPADQPSTLQLLLDLTAMEPTSHERSPMAVAIVIDRSGSMAGEKIRQARQASKLFVSRLADDDQIAFVSFASDSSVDLPLTAVKGQRARIDRVIDEIMDSGGTDIGAGLGAGLQALRKAEPGANRRLLLVSDGNANQGITDSGALAAIATRAHQDGITVSTLGLGLDFNEDLLAQMTQNAGGGYYYARDPEAINQAFDKELNGLTRLAARNVEVGLDLGPDVIISEVHGYRTEVRRGRVVIPVGDMASGERRRVMVELKAGAVIRDTKLELTKVVLAYDTAGKQGAREHQGALSVCATRSDIQLANGERREVTEAFEAARAAQAREQAAFSFQAGNKQQALRRLKAQIDATRVRNNVLKSVALEEQLNEMEQAARGIAGNASDSEFGKDLVKHEKLRAREVVAY